MTATTMAPSFFETTPNERSERGAALVAFARARLIEELGGPKAERPRGEWTKTPCGTFVTLRWTDGRLQGCIGNLEPRRAIVDEVAHNTVAAAVLDPRASRLRLEDAGSLDVELSILSPLEKIVAHTEAEAVRQLVPGVHGVVFSNGGHRATFLPVMWSRMPDLATFMGALKEKAGFSPDHWSDEARLERYTVDKFVDLAASRG
jgi:AmmeMemoRadiSam system protein A